MTVQKVQNWGCSACGRTIYGQGVARIIEAARAADGKDLVSAYITGRDWLLRRKVELVDEAVIAHRFDEYARTGRLRVPRQLNDLDTVIGLREIKAGPARFPFYELTDQLHGGIVTRLTHGFTKGSKETPPKEIRRAKAIMHLDKQSS